MSTSLSHSPAHRSATTECVESRVGGPGIVVDYPGSTERMEVPCDEKEIVEWVTKRPTAGPVHFYFSASAPTNLRLQRTLLSMGCIVTRRFQISQ